MILGIGVDLASVKRIREFLERWGKRARQRCFTEIEQAYCDARLHPEIHFASRFAAKEALAKALGTGLSRGVAWKDIEVIRGPGEPPGLVLHGRTRRLAEAMGVERIHLSLGHEQDMAIAFVTLEGKSYSSRRIESLENHNS
jgi:holo-[acyl-carrier protein] synthase